MDQGHEVLKLTSQTLCHLCMSFVLGGVWVCEELDPLEAASVLKIPPGIIFFRCDKLPPAFSG